MAAHAFITILFDVISFTMPVDVNKNNRNHNSIVFYFNNILFEFDNHQQHIYQSKTSKYTLNHAYGDVSLLHS